MSLNTTPATWAAASVPTAANFNTEIRDAFAGILAAWESYTPTLSGWTLSNGVITGKYLRLGKTIHARGTYTVGSGDTKVGEPRISLPVTAHAALTDPFPIGAVSLFDTSANLTYIYTALGRSSTTFAARGLSAFAASPTAPFTWATGDVFAWAIAYEAA